MNVGIYCLLLALSAAGAAGAAGAAEPRPSGIEIEVAAGPHDRRKTPVAFDLPDALKDALAVRLTRSMPASVVDAQVLQGERPRVLFILDSLPAGETRRYRLEKADPPAEGKARVTCVDDGKQLSLDVGERPVLRYQAATVEPPEGIESYYRRSGQIHPLFAPSGRVVTDDFPPDHKHQHAIFFAWVNTTFEGRHLDFWNQNERTTRIEHAATLGTTGGPVFGQFRVKLRHDDMSAPGGPKPVLDEVWTVRAYNVSDVFLVDLESRQTCAGPEPLTINAYHYGGMGIRGSRDWFEPTVKGNNAPDPSRSGRSDFLTSERKNRATGNHTRPNWVDLSGQIGGLPSGVAILDHPDNFRFPQPVRLHPNKPYFCFAPMVLGAFAIAPGQPYISRYRFAVHDGPPDASTLERLWHDYAEPPQVRVVTEE